MHGTAGAQQRQRTDTLRTRADTLRARADSARARSDSLRARGDTLRQPGDTLRQPGDTLRVPADTVTPAQRRARADSLEAEDRRAMAEQRRRADSIKAPIAAAELPVLTDVDGGLRWNREELAASAAITLSDLLERVPGLTVFRSGWIGSPHVAAMMGDFERLRIFYDGIELDAMDPRTGSMHDLSYVQLWPLEEVRIERGAGEIRVHLRSWRVRSTTPSTRVDIGTGDLETNAYRGYFGRRFVHGEVLQLGAAQLSSRDPRGVGDADQLSLFGRAGWAKGRLSVDGHFLRTARERTVQVRDELTPPRPDLPPLDATQTELYARAAWTDSTRGLWGQLIAATSRHSQGNLAYDSTAAQNDSTYEVEPELDFSRLQYIATAGWGRGPLSLSGTMRLRSNDGVNFVSPSVRAAYDASRLSVALYGEQAAERDERRLELSGRFLPLPWLALSGALGQYASTDLTRRPTSLAYRGEVGVRLRNAWLTAGLMSRDTAALVAPVVFDTAFRGLQSRPVRGLFVGIRGTFWKDLGLDMTAMKWDSAGAFRPEYRTRTQLFVNSGLRRRFPSGNFNILAAVTHEYRTVAFFPLDDGARLRSSQYRTLDFLLEIRLLQATLTYQFRNFWNAQFSQVPGFEMHRPVQVYGVRWHFFN